MNTIYIGNPGEGDETASCTIVNDGEKHVLVRFSGDFGGFHVEPLKVEALEPNSKEWTPEQLEAIKKVMKTGIEEDFPCGKKSSWLR